MENKSYILEVRTLEFSKNLIVFCKKLKRDPVSLPIISQLIRSGTSIGANYMEANGASSSKDFKNKIHICKKEAQETKYWFSVLSETFPEYSESIGKLWLEVDEFSRIFGKIIGTMNKQS